MTTNREGRVYRVGALVREAVEYEPTQEGLPAGTVAVGEELVGVAGLAVSEGR